MEVPPKIHEKLDLAVLLGAPAGSGKAFGPRLSSNACL
jgi:hypothetical protein